MYEEIKKARLQAMKDKNQVAKNFYSTFLGEVDRSAKKGSNLDEVAATVAKRMAKNIQENIKDYKNHHVDTSREEEELVIISKYLTESKSEEETREIVQNIINGLDAPNMGQVMKSLSGYGDTIDKKLVNAIVKEILGA